MNMVQEFARSAKNWDSTWTLILHGWMMKQDYLDELKKACDDKHVILFEDVVEPKQLDFAIFTYFTKVVDVEQCQSLERKRKNKKQMSYANQFKNFPKYLQF